MCNSFLAQLLKRTSHLPHLFHTAHCPDDIETNGLPHRLADLIARSIANIRADQLKGVATTVIVLHKLESGADLIVDVLHRFLAAILAWISARTTFRTLRTAAPLMDVGSGEKKPPLMADDIRL